MTDLLGHLKLIVCFVPEYFLICMRAREKHNTDCEKKNTAFFPLNQWNKVNLLVNGLLLFSAGFFFFFFFLLLLFFFERASDFPKIRTINRQFLLIQPINSNSTYQQKDNIWKLKGQPPNRPYRFHKETPPLLVQPRQVELKSKKRSEMLTYVLYRWNKADQMMNPTPVPLAYMS